MTEVEIVVFNDKSWVRLSEYQNLQEENAILKEQIEKMKHQNEKMRNCVNCKNMIKGTRDICIGCFNLKHWELEE